MIYLSAGNTTRFFYYSGKVTETYSNSKISYYDETITMTYTGARTITNKFNCGTKLLSKGEILTQSDKKIVLEWSTTLACRPVQGEECSLTENGERTLEGEELFYVELMRNCWQADSIRRPSARQVVRILKHWRRHCEGEQQADIWQDFGLIFE